MKTIGNWNFANKNKAKTILQQARTKSINCKIKYTLWQEIVVSKKLQVLA